MEKNKQIFNKFQQNNKKIITPGIKLQQQQQPNDEGILYQNLTSINIKFVSNDIEDKFYYSGNYQSPQKGIFVEELKLKVMPQHGVIHILKKGDEEGMSKVVHSLVAHDVFSFEYQWQQIEDKEQLKGITLLVRC